MSRQRRSFSPEFKLDAARLVVDQGYSIAESAHSLDVGTTAPPLDEAARVRAWG